MNVTGTLKKAVNGEKFTNQQIQMGNGNQSSECRRIKRRKLSHNDCKNLDVTVIPDANGSRRWSMTETQVETEIMEDMGVGKLVEEDMTERIIKPRKSSVKVQTTHSLNVEQPGSTSVGTIRPEADTSLSNDFFIFRRSEVVNAPGPDQSEKLSDEIMLMIFRMLPKKMVVRCAMVCKRWQRIAYDESLWCRLDLSCRVLKPGSLGYALQRGVLILRLASTTIMTPVFSPSCSLLDGDRSKVQYLDLSMAVIRSSDLATLLCTCESLHKLSLEHCELNDKCCSAIAKNRSLEVLNLSGCEGLTKDGLKSILTGCRRLLELNLAWTDLSTAGLEILCEFLPCTVQRLNISGCRKTLADKHIQLLVELCPNIVELDLSDCTSLTSQTIEMISSLNKLEHIALNRCYSITASSYLLLGAMDSLMYLDVIGLFVDQALLHLEKNLPNIGINKFQFSSIARPTVGIRRTSIWGLRVR
ncbi:S-phase kinase-associated protein 2 isoform X2 [Anabrus simplex]|uniref:S-phase kinase-associated protein 2 isoform X2 n=1 Tax=Anabrus simplex TaxID=316456 RepID=UPI0034DD54A1